ncbi:MAG TPA: hypothetical protein VIF83_11960 [Gemmatimonadaceae bacterium]
MATAAPAISTSTAQKFRAASIPFAAEWPIYAVIFSSTCIVVGLLWDISWHRTIGRDTFWSPPHLLEQIAAVVAGLTCGYVVLRTTFAGSAEARGISVRVWQIFQGPLGAWVCIWGTMMMITSAPFDNWWHNAYGLDVRIISPPHMVLAAGMIAIELGAMLMVLGAHNRATNDTDRKRLGLLFAYAAGIVVVMAAILLQEDAAYGNHMHGAKFYRLTGAVLGLFLVAFARSSSIRWPATATAGLYMLIVMVSIWAFELSPATPRLAPIYNAVTHMVPTPFPMLLIFPALAIDILMQRFGTTRDWTLSLIIGVSFVAVMLAVHWFWAEFLLSPGARNFFFGVDKWDYGSTLGSWRYQFWNLDVDSTGKWSAAKFAKGMGLAALLTIIAARIGLWAGTGMSRIKR